MINLFTPDIPKKNFFLRNSSSNHKGYSFGCKDEIIENKENESPNFIKKK